MSKLREWRQSKGLTLEQFGSMIGTSAVSVFRIESGRQWPRPKLVAAIERETNRRVSMVDLLENHAPPKKRRRHRITGSAAE